MGYDLILDSKMIRALYRKLIFNGYTKEEAGNLVARLMGLDPAEKGWTVRELQYLRFLEYLDKQEKKIPS